MQGKLSRAARMLLGFTALMGVVNSAVAAGNTMTLAGNATWTVYAFGNAQAVADAFRALSNFAASGTFQSIVSMVAVMGVLGVGASGGFNPSQARKLIGYFVGVFLTCYFLFGVGNDGPLVVNLEVIDTVDMTWKAPVTVPAVVGIPAAIISSAGYRITQSIEASFALPEELKMSNGAPFNLAASMIADASQARISDPNLASSLAYYVQDCFTIGVARGNLVADTLIHSTDFLNDIRFDSESVMVNTMLQPPVGQPGVVTCGEAWSLINTAVTASGSGAADFLKDASAWTKTPAMSVVNAAADRTAQWASNNGVTDGGAMVKQAAVLSAFRGAYSQAATQTGNSEFLTGLALTQATESQRSSWITGAEVFNKSMGYIFAILQVFVYAITPLILCAALVPALGLALLKNFCQILLWLAIWQPMLAIVNFIVISMQQAELGGILSNGGAYGFTLSNMGIVSEKSANLRAAATFVGTMVPALAWAMVKGSMDFSRVIGSAVGENFAQGAANTMTTGNYSLNQASMDSFTANKHSTAATGAWGGGHTTADSTASREQTLGGSAMANASGERLQLNTSSSLSTNAGSQGATNAGLSNAGSDGVGGSVAKTHSAAGADMRGGGTTEGSAVATGLHGSVGAGANFRGPGGPSGKKADGTQAPGGPVGQGQGDGPGSQAGTPIALKGKMAEFGERFATQANANGSGTLSGTKTKGDNFTTNSNLTESGGTTTAGTKNTNFTKGASTGETASTSHGAQSGDAQTLTGINSAFSRAEVMTSYMRMNNTMTQGEWGRAAPMSSNLGDKAEKLGQHGAIANDVAAENNLNAKREDQMGNKVDGYEKKAKAMHGNAAGKADAVYARESRDAAAAQAPAQKAPSARLGETVGDTVSELYDGAKGMMAKVKEAGGQALERATERTEEARAAATSNPQPAPAVVAPPNASESAKRDAQLANVAGGMMGAGNSPFGQRPQQPAAQPQGAQQGQAQGAQSEQPPQRPAPGTVNSERQAAHPGKDADKGQQVASQSGNQDRGGPKPGERNNQEPGPARPEERNQLAQGDQQQRERELQDRQDRQLAATAAVGQALQATQMAPAAQAGVPAQAPLPAGMDQAPQLAAGPQQQQPGTNPVAPNPFSSDKGGESEGQLQGQVQMAEQRAERMGNQLRGVEGMLASADGRNPSDLPELITQARDMVRNA